jgi:serine/threonine-protein kinase
MYCLDDGTALVTDMGSGSRALDEPATAILSTSASGSRLTANNAAQSRFWQWTSVVLGMLFVAAVGLLVFKREPATKAQASPVSFDISVPDKADLNVIRYPTVDISPDGSTIVFSASTAGIARLYIRKINETDVHPLSGTEGAMYPVFSPDGKWIAFITDFTLKKVSLDGLVVPVIKIGDARGLTWADNEHLIYSPEPAQPLFRISADGGSPEQLTQLDASKSERTHRWPQMLPGGKAVIFTVGSIDSPDNYDNADIEAVILATGERKLILQKASVARYIPSGKILFSRGGALYSEKFDPDTLSASGTPETVLQGIAGDITTGAVDFSIADNGTLAYVPGNSNSNSRGIFWVDRNGDLQPVNITPAQYTDVRISPDGARMAVLIGSSGGGDVWVYDFARSTATRLTFDQKNATPLWSADGKFIYYSSVDASASKTIVMKKPADGSREAEAVASSDNAAYIKAIEPDQTTAIFDYGMLTNRGDIMSMSIGTPGPMNPIVNSTFNEYASALSPDGRWLAYQSPESGRPEIYVLDLSPGGGRWQISTEGGEEPRWSPNGNELFYRNDTVFMSAPITTKGGFEAGTPKPLFTGVFNLRSNSGVSYDVDPKKDRFLMIRPSSENMSSDVRVVVNWTNPMTRP